MKYIFTLLFVLFSTLIFAQEEKPTEEEEIVIVTETDEGSEEVAFQVIEHVPVYYGCNEKLSNLELKNCMNRKVIKHVSSNFNADIANNLGLPDGRVRINVIFKINKEGKVVDIKARAPHPALEKEAERVISLLPDMDKPGIQRGKPVIVPYSLPIVFQIDNSSKKLTKKERRRLRRSQKN
ncbi:energy transducer TonB [uncultured Psychroserpens sp.]|uniref:energy transducer TonB n=1 Tax=uncultured Psychroserpens sp. TaxID=255436 RepID=UPI00262F18E2|nr:energy transducer TonB [uncultured Psychroserpens sp.]